jgi:hypothetical protein
MDPLVAQFHSDMGLILPHRIIKTNCMGYEFLTAVVTQCGLVCRYSHARILGTHWIEGWLGARAGMDVVTKRKSPALSGIEICRPARSQPLSVLYISGRGQGIDPRIPGIVVNL